MSKSYKVGDKVRMTRDLSKSFRAQTLHILEIDGDKYRLGKTNRFGSIWLTKEWFE